MLQYTHFIKCPKCGSINIAVYQKNGMHCEECDYIYFHNAAAAVAAIIEYEDTIILTRRHIEPQKGLLDLPGGFVDYRESFETAIAREVREEINLDIYDIRYFSSSPNTYIYKSITYFTVDAVFTCRATRIEDASESHEIAEVIRCKPADIDFTSIAFESTRAVLKQYVTKMNA